jgi:hypothetical protein
MATTAQDAPDYTLLSDVNVVGSVTIDVNVVGTVNVNIANQPVEVLVQNTTLNVDAVIVDSRLDIKVVITDCVVDLKIYTPAGKWIITPELLATYAVNPYRSVRPGTEETVISASGFKGRLKQIGGELVTAGSPFSIYGNVEIRIYVDGLMAVRLKIDEIDFLNGRATYWLWTALVSCLNNNLTPPFNCVKYTTSPERWLIMPFFSNPAAAVTMAVVDRSTGLLVRVGFYLKVDAEFQNSVEVRVYNGDSSNTLGVMLTGLLGEYVWPTG